MSRRDVLTAIGTTFVVPFIGCLGTANSARKDDPDFEIRFKEHQGETANAVRERIIVMNLSKTDQNLQGYTLEYSSGYEYKFTDGPTLEPRAKVAIVSRGATTSVAESDPPTYYRDADLPSLVLEDGEETVKLLDEAGIALVVATYRSE